MATYKAGRGFITCFTDPWPGMGAPGTDPMPTCSKLDLDDPAPAWTEERVPGGDIWLGSIASIDYGPKGTVWRGGGRRGGNPDWSTGTQTRELPSLWLSLSTRPHAV